MKSLLLMVGLAVPVAVTGLSAHAAPRIDARGVALIDREIARLRSFKSFSVRGVETVEAPQGRHEAKIALSLQFPYRTAIQVDLLSPKNKPSMDKARLLVEGSRVLSSVGGSVAQTRSIGSQDDRADLLLQASQGVVSFGFSFFALRSGINPAKEESTVSVQVVRLREGKTDLQNVVVQQKSSLAGQPLETYEYGFDEHGLRRLFARRAVGGKTSTVLGHFETVQSNWKGSQTLTDAAVYNWNVVAPDVAVPKVVVPTADVSPQARAIFARAVKLYSGLKGLRLKWTVREEDSDSTERRELRFDRAGRLYLTGSFALFNIAANDGETSIEYDSELEEYAEKKVAADQADQEAQSQLEFAAILDGTLVPASGENPISADEIEAKIGAEIFETLRATVLPAQPFSGEACDLVRISTVEREEDKKTLFNKPETFWFARSDGRLLRFQTQRITYGRVGERADAQITLQEFNPQFEAKEFSFAIPEGTKERQDD